MNRGVYRGECMGRQRRKRAGGKEKVGGSESEVKRESRQQHEPYGETRTNREEAMAAGEEGEQMFK